jgi:hypothetical protein
LTDDVFMSMPPMPFEHEGRNVVANFCASIFGSGRRFDLVRTDQTVSPPSGPTSALPMASAMAWSSTFSRLLATDLRYEPLRKHCASMVRATAVGSRPARAASGLLRSRI